MKSKGPVAIVTAAGKGIGAACAEELAQRGYRLALMSPSKASVALAEKLGGIGLQGSVIEEADLKRLVDMTLEKYGRIDAVVNNTGRISSILKRYSFAMSESLSATEISFDPDSQNTAQSLPDAAWHDALDLLFLNVVRMCRLVTDQMKKQGGGAIVNISSMDAREPRQCYPIGILRLALHGFSKLYADRHGRDGIRINSVLPGIIENAEMSAAEVRKAIPLNRRGTVREIAKTTAFLLSEDAGYITGQNILVDGALNRSV